MLKQIAGNDRAIAAYSRAHKWTPLAMPMSMAARSAGCSSLYEVEEGKD